MARLARVVIPQAPPPSEAIAANRPSSPRRQSGLSAHGRRGVPGGGGGGLGLLPDAQPCPAAPSRPEAPAEAVGATHVRYTRAASRGGRAISGRDGSPPSPWTRTICVPASAMSAGSGGPEGAGHRLAVVQRARPCRGAGRSPADSRAAGRAPERRDGRILRSRVEEEARRKLRRASSTGRPLGASDWIKALEASTGRALAAPVMGRPVVGVARGG